MPLIQEQQGAQPESANRSHKRKYVEEDDEEVVYPSKRARHEDPDLVD